MAAYASVVSLMTLIDQIQNHPCPPITLHKGQLESLCQKITFLQEFLEVYPHSAIQEAAADGLESRIAHVGYTAADVIEFHMANRIRHRSASHGVVIQQLHRDLQKVIQDIDLVTREVMEIKGRIGNEDLQLNRHLVVRDGLRRPPLVGQKNAMVGFDDVFNQVLDKLTGYQSSRQIIPIVGMGGIGKTTLARNAYECEFFVRHFDVRSWVESSQDYNVRDILLKLLPSQNKKGNSAQLNEQELGHELYKCLFNRRYLVVIDDVWGIDVWNEIGHFFPDNNNGSRVIITTRVSSVALELSKDKIVMDFLDDHKSWNLFCNAAFGEEACPPELEESGRKIAKDCKGLPLSIVVMGGLLAKSKQRQEDWVLVAKKLNSGMNLEHEEHCLHILYTSFEHLPIHLKPLFLYVGLFPEDSEIKVSKLVKLWVAEGFVRPICGKTLELVAEEYLMDLIDRNLVLVTLTGYTGRIKVCTIHDVIRDLCIREAEKERFLCVARKHDVGTQQNLAEYRRVAIHPIILKDEDLCEALDTIKSTLLHSMVCHIKDVFPQFPSTFRVLRFTTDIDLDTREFKLFVQNIFHIFSLRFLDYVPMWSLGLLVPSSIHLPWNLQTLIVFHEDLIQPLHIWNMYQLRHVKVKLFFISDPPAIGNHVLVLQNLQTLSIVVNLKFGEEVIRRIPNIRKLKLIYRVSFEECSQYHLSNLDRLQKLESLSCSFPFWSFSSPSRSGSNKIITFPHSLIKLELSDATLYWEDVTIKIGTLPHLQVLKLGDGIQGSEWNLVEGKFQRLRFLEIATSGYDCNELKLEYWRVESIHFPCLEHLSLKYVRALKEIPSGIGDTPKLQSIKLLCCSDAIVDSAQKILDEQEELGNTGLKVLILKSDNFGGGFVELRPNIQDKEEEHL